MRMQKRKFRIGEFAKTLNVERFVIRFWEKEFNLKTDRSHGGQRFYSEDDLATFTEIKELLYKKGFTIAGAKKQILQGAYTDHASDKTIDRAAGRVFGSKKTEILSEAEYQPSHKSENLACNHPDHLLPDNQLSEKQSISETYIQELTNQLTTDLTIKLTEQIKQDMAEQFATDMADKLADQAALFKAEKAELVRQLAELRAHLQKLQALFIK